jgi:NADH:ubiquinone oxidoreductase subunit F (NADH-binding)
MINKCIVFQLVFGISGTDGFLLSALFQVTPNKKTPLPNEARLYGKPTPVNEIAA